MLIFYVCYVPAVVSSLSGTLLTFMMSTINKNSFGTGPVSQIAAFNCDERSVTSEASQARATYAEITKPVNTISEETIADFASEYSAAVQRITPTAFADHFKSRNGFLVRRKTLLSYKKWIQADPVKHIIKLEQMSLDTQGNELPDFLIGAGALFNAFGFAGKVTRGFRSIRNFFKQEVTCNLPTVVSLEMITLMLVDSYKAKLFSIAKIFYWLCNSVTGTSVESFFMESIGPFLSSVLDRITTAPAKVRQGGDQFIGNSEEDFQFFHLIPAGAGLAAIVACILGGRHVAASATAMKEFKKYSELGLGLTRLVAGMKTMQDLVLFVINKTKEQLMISCPEKAVANSLLVQCEKKNIAIRTFLRVATALTDPARYEEVMVDVNTQNHVTTCCHIYGLYRHFVVAGEIVPSAPASAHITSLHREVQKIATAHRSQGTITTRKRTPFTIALYGGPGVGKTSIADALARDLLDPIRLNPKLEIHREVGDPIVYTRNAADSFWSGFSPKTAAVVYDDFAATTGDAPKESQYTEFLHITNEVSYKPRMADVESKGIEFDVPLIVLTTNDPYPREQTIKYPHALWRRRQLLVECKRLEDGTPVYNILSSDPETTVLPFPYLKIVYLTNGEMLRVPENMLKHELLDVCSRSFNSFIDTGMVRLGQTSLVSQEMAPSRVTVVGNGLDLGLGEPKVLQTCELNIMDWMEEQMYPRRLFKQIPIGPINLYCGPYEAAEDARQDAYATLVKWVRDGYPTPLHFRMWPGLGNANEHADDLGERIGWIPHTLTLEGEILERIKNVPICNLIEANGEPFLDHKGKLCVRTFDNDRFYIKDFCSRCKRFDERKNNNCHYYPNTNWQDWWDDPGDMAIPRHLQYCWISEYADASTNRKWQHMDYGLRCTVYQLFRYGARGFTPYMEAWRQDLHEEDLLYLTQKEFAHHWDQQFQQKRPQKRVSFKFVPNAQSFIGNSEDIREFNLAGQDVVGNQEEIPLQHHHHDLDDTECPECEALISEVYDQESRWERFTEWCTQNRSPLRLAVSGFGMVLFGVSCYKTFNWLQGKKHPDSVMTMTSRGELEVLVKQNFSERLHDVVLDYLSIATAATLAERAGHCALDVMDVMLGNMVSGDSRTRRVQGRQILSMRGNSWTGEEMMKCFEETLEEAGCGQVLPDFRKRARERLAKLGIQIGNGGAYDNPLPEVLLEHAVGGNLFWITRLGDKPAAMNGLGLVGNTALVPSHLFRDPQPGDEFEVCVSGGNRLPSTSRLVYGMQAKKGFGTIWPCSAQASCTSNDLCIVTFCASLSPFKDIRKHLATDADMSRLSRTMAVLAHRMRDLSMNTQSCVAKASTMLVSYSNSGGDTSYAERSMTRSYQYQAAVGPGFCGAVLLSKSVHVRGVIMGVHLAQTVGTGTGYAAPLTREWIDDQLDAAGHHDPDDYIGNATLEGVYADTQGRPIFFPDTFEEEPEFARTTVEVSGQQCITAVLKPRWVERVTNRSDIKPSPIFDKVVPHVTVPAPLSKSDSNLSEEKKGDPEYTPLRQGIQKYAEPTRRFNPAILLTVFGVVCNYFSKVDPLGFTTRRLLTLKEMINGVREAGYNRINFQTSPGLPYKRFPRAAGSKGKGFLFRQERKPKPDECPDDIPWEIDSQFLKDRIEEYETNARAGKRTLNLAYTNLKDERISLQKAKDGKTRLFECEPMHFTLLVRKYFGCFIAACNQSPVTLPAAVGIDPASPQWTHLFNRLNRFGGNVIAGDFAAWDGRLDPQVMELAVEVVNNWYNDGPECARARRVIIMDHIHHFTLAGNAIVYKNQGMPSGSAMTADLNSLCNIIYMLTACLSIAEEHKIHVEPSRLLAHEDSLLEMTFYGDDHVLAPHPEIQEFFNFNSLQQFFLSLGIGYTDALKTGLAQPDFTKLTACSYLKTGFRPHPRRPHLILAPISTNSIHEELNWLRTEDQLIVKEALWQNIMSALRFAYHHGQPYYDDLLAKINLALAETPPELGLELVESPFRTRDLEWIAQHYE